MAQDRVSDVSASDLPEPVGEWIEAIAADRDVEEEELIARLLATGSDGLSSDSELAERLDDLDTQVDMLGDRVDDLDADLETKIEDVRDRVIQVKREVDEKAATSHDHPDLEERVETLAAEVETLVDSLADVAETVDDRRAEGEVDQDQVRDVVEDATGDLSRKLDVLASAVLDLRDRTASLAERQSRRAAVDALRETANLHGVTTGACEACGETITIPLLSEPHCPHCEAGLRDLQPKRGFFGSNVLLTGTPPALDGEVDVGDDLDEFVEK